MRENVRGGVATAGMIGKEGLKRPLDLVTNLQRPPVTRGYPKYSRADLIRTTTNSAIRYGGYNANQTL
jgi:hypothetical protein